MFFLNFISNFVALLGKYRYNNYKNYNKQEIWLIDFLPSLPLTLEEIVTVVAIRCDELLMKVLWLQGIERFISLLLSWSLVFWDTELRHSFCLLFGTTECKIQFHLFFHINDT